MFIFLYGADAYRSRRKLNEIIEHYKKIRRNGLNLKCFEAKNLNFQDFIDEIQQVSIFKEKKLIILFNVFSSAEFKKDFLAKEKEDKSLTKIASSNDIVLFYEEEEVSQKDPLFVFLDKHAKCQEFKLLDSQKLKKWIEKEFFMHKSEIEQKAIQMLIDFVGNDLWRLSNEIKKLASYKKGKKIAAEDVELLVRPKIEADIFKTIEAIAVKNKKQALGLLNKHLEKGDSPLYLLSMINFQFRNLLIIKDLIERGRPYYALVKEARLHPYVVKKSYSQAQKFTFSELKKIFQKIFQADLRIKTGRIDASSALDLFIAEI